MGSGVQTRRRAMCRYHGQPTVADQPRRRAHRWWLSTVLACAVAGARAEQPPLLPLADVLIVHADRAWETDSGDAMYFEGHLQLRGNNWRIEADSAHLRGDLDDPDLVVVKGAPARIVVGAADEREPLEGHGRHLEFEPRSETLRLEGGAMIVKGRQSISSESIKYLLARDTFAAGSHGRVRVVTTPH